MDAVDGSDSEFIEKFEKCGFEEKCWTHEAHVRMAWIYFARSATFGEGMERIRAGIQRFNASLNSKGYHETVTVAFARLIFFRRLHGDAGQTWREFSVAHPELLSKTPPVLSSYYSAAVTSLTESRSTFLPPDLLPLPPVGKVRPVRDADATGVQRIYAPYVANTVVSFEKTPPDEEDLRGRFRDVTSQTPWLVFDVDGEIAGYAYASKHRSREAYQWTTEVSAYVREDFKRLGIGRLLYTRLFAELDRLGFHVALAGISLPNEASVGFHESLGFTPVGIYRGIGFKFGKWHDVGWWQTRLKPLASKPGPLLAPA